MQNIIKNHYTLCTKFIPLCLYYYHVLQLSRCLEACEERLEARTEELNAAMEGITLLQQDLALQHRQSQTK